jgi:LAO/AO transport system kinase
MRDLSGDAGIFIRSMASRGSLGGLGRSTAAMTQVFDAAGFEIIIIETVGAGQSEVDIARLAHTTLVVEAPGMGDDIQAIKAGILEIADILVINKADRPGVENTERALKNNLELAHPVARVFRHHGQEMTLPGGPDLRLNSETSFWIPPIQRTTATDGSGLPELISLIEKHTEHLKTSGDWSRREQSRLTAEFNLLVQETLVARLHASLPQVAYQHTLQQVFERRASPREAVNSLLALSSSQ